MFKKKLKINPKNHLFWLYVIGFLCAFFVIAKTFEQSNDLVVKAIAFVAGWWIFLVTFHLSESTNQRYE